MRAILATAVATIALVVGGMYWVTHRESADVGFCQADVGDTLVEVDLEQAKWVSWMAAIGIDRQLPARATSIAIATAFQESKISNIEHGDRDSVGIFQQRPSQGWGSIDQIMDPRYSINAFYDVLVHVPDYQNLAITEAAQRVQRSAYPDAYAQHEPQARALASALRGYSPAAFACAIEPTSGSIGTVRDHMSEQWPTVRLSSRDEEHVASLGVSKKDTTTIGWAFAHYLVANAAEFGIRSVSFDGHRWDADERLPRWASAPDAPTDAVHFTLG